MQTSEISLGILAGGRASRLGGIDKAWMRRDGIAQIVRLIRRLRLEVGAILISANRDLDRYAGHDCQVVRDMHVGLGPLSGLHALAQAADSKWLLTVPVDVVDINDCLLPSLAAAGAQGAYAIDDDGPQPLVALWPLLALRDATNQAIASHQLAVHALQARLAMPGVAFHGLRLGNLNTPEQLAAAGVEQS